MSSCLYECLKEAGLERHHSEIKSHGYDTAFSLLYLRPAELQEVGITTDSERQRFLQLVQIIASFHQGGDLSPRRTTSPIRNPSPDITNTQHSSVQVRVYQSSDTSDSTDSSVEYIPSPRRRNNRAISSTHARESIQVKRHMPENSNTPVARSYINKSVRQNFELNTNSNNRTSCAVSSSRKEHSVRHRSFFHERDFEGDRNNNVRQPKQNTPRNQDRIPLPVQDQVIDPDLENANPTAESKMKVQKVMHNKRYNYGLPRETLGEGDSLTPKLSRKTPTRNPIARFPSPAVAITSHPAYNTPTNSRDVFASPQNKRRITVCVRKRPLIAQEEQSGGFDVITTNQEDGGREGGVVVHELKHTVDMSEFVQQNVFQFDKVFAERATNKDVYEGAVKPMVDWIMTQNNRATCFGYGQTGAGKTHTLLGDENEPGVFLHAAKDVLSRLSSQRARNNKTSKRGFSLSISLYEIYCSRIFDLLNDHKRLQALEDSNKQIHIHGLKLIPVDSMQTLLQVLHQGLSTRSVGVTGANQDSSRSHAIVQLTVRDINDTEFSRLSFIDLAGSERACDALRDSDKQNRLEGAEINQSLLALKECIRSLDLALAHTPFRQSKLTQVLRDSFIGNSKTCMIANISPSHSSLEHTMNTLRYASRVKELRRKPVASSTPRRRRGLITNSVPRASRGEARRPFTADPMQRKNLTPNGVLRPSVQNTHISRSVSIESGMKVMDYTTFTGSGRQLSRTPPPMESPALSVHASKTPGSSDSATPINFARQSSPNSRQCGNETPSNTQMLTTVRRSENAPARKYQSIFTPEAIGCSSTPNKRVNRTEGARAMSEQSGNSAKIQISTNDTTTSDSTPLSTPRFMNDTELVGGIAGVHPGTSGHPGQKISSGHSPEVSNKEEDQSNLIGQALSSQSTSRSNTEKTSGVESSVSSSVVAELGSSRESKVSKTSDPSSSSNNTKTANSQIKNAPSTGSGTNSPQDGTKNESHTSEEMKTRGSVLGAVNSNKEGTSSTTVTSGLQNEIATVAPLDGASSLPESKKNPGLPSPQRFLTYLKDKHHVEPKHLRRQLRKSSHRRKQERQDMEAFEDEAQNSDQSASNSNPSSSSCSTSRSNLVSSVQQHHQHLMANNEEGQSTGPVIVTDVSTPPRLPSPKLDQSQPRRSSRASRGSSPRSMSPSTGGHSSPNSTITSHSPSTTTAVTSASELRARLAAAVNEAKLSSDSDDKSTKSQKTLTSSSRNKALRKSLKDTMSNMNSSSDKENSRNSSQKDECIHRAQSEVVIAHQEHISEILRISIEEEQLYHSLREQWGRGTSFETYTKSLRKLLARKTQSIEALKVQLALYDRVCKSTG